MRSLTMIESRLPFHAITREKSGWMVWTERISEQKFRCFNMQPVNINSSVRVMPAGTERRLKSELKCHATPTFSHFYFYTLKNPLFP